MTALFLSPVCQASTTVQEPYQIHEYRCPQGRFQVVARRCIQGRQTWFGHPFMLVNLQTGQGFYVNRFGETQAASVQVMPDDTYIPAC